MPTLPTDEERPTRADRAALAARRAGAAIGADARVTVRALVCLAVAAVVVSLAPTPWSAVGMVALLLLALDWARTKRGG